MRVVGREVRGVRPWGEVGRREGVGSKGVTGEYEITVRESKKRERGERGRKECCGD